MKLTDLERRVLKALYEDIQGNGFDFGFVDAGHSAVKRPDQLSGIVSSLSKKGLINPFVYDGDRMFDFLDPVTGGPEMQARVEALLGIEKGKPA